MTIFTLKEQGSDDDMAIAVFFLGIAALFLTLTTIAVYAYSSASLL